jgi:crossover junction endodeoxyribonuclease RuvC
MNIIGIDPGLTITGVGILEISNKNVLYLDHAVIRTTPKDKLTDRLSQICSKLTEIIDYYNPKSAAIEDIFFSVNVKSAILLGQTRGALIATLLNKNIEVMEFTALQVKKTVVGYGKADKEQVKRMVELHLNKKFDKTPYDVTDALACGISLGLSLTGGYNFV